MCQACLLGSLLPGKEEAARVTLAKTPGFPFSLFVGSNQVGMEGVHVPEF